MFHNVVMHVDSSVSDDFTETLNSACYNCMCILYMLGQYHFELVHLHCTLCPLICCFFENVFLCIIFVIMIIMMTITISTAAPHKIDY